MQTIKFLIHNFQYHVVYQEKLERKLINYTFQEKVLLL